MDKYLTTYDFAVSGESFDLYWHEGLDMLSTMPRPEDMEPYYASDRYISHTDARNGLVNTLYQEIKKLSLTRKLRLIDACFKPGARLLDVGAGTGDFVAAARKRGWNAIGMEPGLTARERAALKGIELTDSFTKLEGKYDVITLWHVLEHLPDLDKEIDRLTSSLQDGGTLVLALPNFRSWDARHYGKYWAAYDVPRHLWHFSRKSIGKLFGRRGFKIVRAYPLWFDAFYISLLSEKYQANGLGLLRGFVNGCRSNLAALRTGEYSSLIYILQRA